ncbi:MAG: hypothetical protein V1697_03620 [Candidatus Levyibacteriota bacterium]
MKEFQSGAETAIQYESVEKIQQHFHRLYDKRDNIYLPSREERINLLSISIGDLTRVVFKGLPKDDQEECLARIASRIFCIARSVNNVSVAEGLSRKYPIEGCAYCNHMPCICKENRPEPLVNGPRDEQRNWNLTTWQGHLNAMYGENNRKKGINFIVNRLNMERDEFISLEAEIKTKPLTIEEAECEYQLEIADTMAWTIAAANFLDINLDKAVDQRYGNGCRRCGSIPCMCGPHDLKSITNKREREIGKLVN